MGRAGGTHLHDLLRRLAPPPPSCITPSPPTHTPSSHLGPDPVSGRHQQALHLVHGRLALLPVGAGHASHDGGGDLSGELNGRRMRRGNRQGRGTSRECGSGRNSVPLSPRDRPILSVSDPPFSRTCPLMSVRGSRSSSPPPGLEAAVQMKAVVPR